MAAAENTFQSILMKDAEWCNYLGITDFDSLNRIIRTGRAVQLVNLCEARHENRCSAICQSIVDSGARVILIAGPSSSGKTSTSLRIGLQCKVHGLNPRTIELDNYFEEREKTPKLPDGSYDFECLEAMDTTLLNDHIGRLLDGEEVSLPTFDFIAGKKIYKGNTMKLGHDDILVLEGIHGLNPALTAEIPDYVKFKIFVSDISSMSDYDEAIRVSDNRLMRRAVRDVRTRGHSCEDTINGWGNVLEGEKKYIYPFQQYADAVFNSTIQYELPLLKHYVSPMLRNIEPQSAAYPKAEQLLSFLDKMEALSVDAINAIPCTSIMREFIGGQILSRELL